MRTLLVMLFISGLVSAAWGQAPIDYGFKAGYVNSYLKFSNGLETYGRHGFSASLLADMPLSGTYSLTPEVKFMQKGSGVKYIKRANNSPEELGTGEGIISLNYLSLLFSLTYSRDVGWGKTLLRFSPRYDIILSGSDNFNSGLPYSYFDNNFGGSMSAGVVFGSGPGMHFFIEGSFHLDFSNIYSSSLQLRSRAIEISVGLK